MQQEPIPANSIVFFLKETKNKKDEEKTERTFCW